MQRILVTGAAGQIGSELVPELRKRYGNENVVAAGHRMPLPAQIRQTGPCTTLDVSDPAQIDRTVKAYDVDTIYHLSSILSALAEQKRQTAYRVNILGLYNILEAAVGTSLERVIIPSSIAAFGPDTPADRTPNETLQKPNTLYGIAKVFGELMGNYYFYQARLRCQGGQAARHRELEDRTHGWNDRLRRSDFLRRLASPPLHMLPETGHLSTDDVRARCHSSAHTGCRSGQGPTASSR